jgi:hypothetical protein
MVLFLEVIVAGLNCILFKIYIKIIFFYFLKIIFNVSNQNNIKKLILNKKIKK